VGKLINVERRDMRMKKSLIGLLCVATLGGVSNIGQPVFAVEVDASVIDISNEKKEINISPVLTFDEMVREVAKENGIPIIQAQQELGFTDESARQARTARATYRTLSQSFTVNASYRPTMRFYCETSESGNFRAIKRILRVEMIRGYNGLSKQFGGTVYVHLEDANRIFYIVNGDFFNNGSTTWNAGVNIGVGRNASIKFGVTNTTSHYQYRYVESRFRF
jgi:hypothetical protein